MGGATERMGGATERRGGATERADPALSLGAPESSGRSSHRESLGCLTW